MWRKRTQDTELDGVGRRLRDERPEVDPLRLDEIKTTAMARANAGRRAGFAGRRLVAGALTLGLMGAGTGGVLAAGGGSSSGGTSAIEAQYSSTTSTSPTSSTTTSTSATSSAKANNSHKKKAKKAKKKAKKQKHIVPRFTG